MPLTWAPVNMLKSGQHIHRFRPALPIKFTWNPADRVPSIKFFGQNLNLKEYLPLVKGMVSSDDHATFAPAADRLEKSPKNLSGSKSSSSLKSRGATTMRMLFRCESLRCCPGVSCPCFGSIFCPHPQRTAATTRSNNPNIPRVVSFLMTLHPLPRQTRT